MLWPSAQYDVAFKKIVEDALSGGTTVLILVAPTPDALCTSLILKELLKADGVMYQVMCVGGYNHLLEVHEQHVENSDELRTVVLLGCGAMVNLEEVFPMPPDTTCYVVDSHRPVDLSNVNSGPQYIVFGDVLLENTIFPGDEVAQEAEAAAEAAAAQGAEADVETSDSDDSDSDDSEDSEDAEDDDESSEDEVEFTRVAAAGATGAARESADANSPGSAATAAGTDVSLGKRGRDSDESEAPLQQQKKKKKKKKKKKNRGNQRPGEGGEFLGAVDADARRRQAALDLAIAEYYKGTYCGIPAAYVAYDLSEQIGRSSDDLLWYAIVGITDHYSHGRLDQDTYDGLYARLQQWVGSRNVDADIAGAAGDAANTAGSAAAVAADDSAAGFDTHVRKLQEGRIKVIEREYRFMLHRHWSVYEGMLHSHYLSSKLGTWRKEGRKRLDTLLAKMGISQRDVQQRFDYMSKSARSKLRSNINQEWASLLDDLPNRPAAGPAMLGVAGPGAHDDRSIAFGSFSRIAGYDSETSAADAAHAVLSMLECGSMHSSAQSLTSPRQDGATASASGGVAEAEDAKPLAEAAALEAARAATLGENFHRACDVLAPSGRQQRSLMRGIDLAKEVQRAVIRQGVTVIEQRLLMNAETFRYIYLNTMADGDLQFFRRPALLEKLALWLIDASRERRLRHGKPHRELPVVLCVLDEANRNYICLGTHGRSGPNMDRNNFGRAFREAADSIDARYKHDGFESSIIEIDHDQVTNFTDALYLTLHKMQKRHRALLRKRRRQGNAGLVA